jgi:hypothetical protein
MGEMKEEIEGISMGLKGRLQVELCGTSKLACQLKFLSQQQEAIRLKRWIERIEPISFAIVD